MNATTITRANAAINRYLELKGYEVLEANWMHGNDRIDFVVRDEYGTLAFVVTEARENTGEGIPEIALDRKSFERIAVSYLTHADVTDCDVRLDAISLLVLGESRAIIRHQVNALGEVG